MSSSSDSIPDSCQTSFARRRFIKPAACAGPIVASVAVLLGMTAAQAGPCTGQIAQLEQQIGQLEAAPPPSGAGEPTGPQSIGAQLHRQPTPGAVENAENRANADGDAALERARKADAAGNADACAEALREAKHLYGVD